MANKLIRMDKPHIYRNVFGWWCGILFQERGETPGEAFKRWKRGGMLAEVRKILKNN